MRNYAYAVGVSLPGASSSAIPSSALVSYIVAPPKPCRRASAWWRTVKRYSPPRRGRARRGAELAGRSFAAVGAFGFVQCSPRSATIGERNMTTNFIEARPKAAGRDRYRGLCRGGTRGSLPQGIQDPGRGHHLGKSEGHSPHVARVRHLNDNPDDSAAGSAPVAGLMLRRATISTPISSPGPYASRLGGGTTSAVTCRA